MGKYYNFTPGEIPDGADVQWLLTFLHNDAEWWDDGHGEKTGRAFEMLTQCWSIIEPTSKDRAAEVAHEGERDPAESDVSPPPEEEYVDLSHEDEEDAPAPHKRRPTRRHR